MPRPLWPDSTNRVSDDPGALHRGVSADTALLLEALTHWDAEIWMTLQAKWDRWHAMQARGRRPRVRALPQSA